MADTTLLIPGTGGIKLLNNGADLGYPVMLQGQAFLLSQTGGGLGEIEPLLSMQHRPGQAAPVKTSLLPGVEVTPGPVLSLAYRELPSNVLPFRYDWRGDIVHSAARLVDLLTERRPQGGKWRIVAHSQGGLVAVAASKLLAARHGGDATAFSDLVRRLVLVGVPLYGTLNAAHALVRGEQLGEAVSASFQKISRTWPALYQMLPDFRAALRQQNQEPAATGFLEAASWQAYPDISADLLARALETKQRYLRRPLEKMAQVKVSIVLATNRPTWDHAVLNPDRTIDFANRGAPGDSLVPSVPTLNRLTPVERQLVDQIGPRETIAEHAFLLSDTYVGELTRRLLTG